MTKKGLFTALCLLLLTTKSLAAETYKIGVLAKDGPVKATKMWKATADYLTTALPGKTFELVPLAFDAVNPAIEKNEVQFFLVNSSMFITTKVKYGATAVATMLNERQGKSLPSFGGVIFVPAASPANSLADLKGKAFMAVEESSFGGWQMALKELVDAGIDPKKDFTKLLFGGKHENVVLAVQNGSVDAGTVRTDTLERMQKDGAVDLTEFKIIGKKEHKDFPFVCSTPLYPEWPMAKTKATPDALAKEVADALKKMKADLPAAKDAQVTGWTDPQDYGTVEALQKTLKIEAYAPK